MCLSCGCDSPDDDHGDKRNITTASLEAAAKAGEVGSTAEVVKNIQSGFEKAGGGKQLAGAGARAKQMPGNNEQSSEGRQGGGGAGSSSGPQ